MRIAEWGRLREESPMSEEQKDRNEEKPWSQWIWTTSRTLSEEENRLQR